MLKFTYSNSYAAKKVVPSPGTTAVAYNKFTQPTPTHVTIEAIQGEEVLYAQTNRGVFPLSQLFEAGDLPA